FDTSVYRAYVTRGIHDPPDAVPPKLVLQWKQDLRARGHGMLNGFVRVFDVDENHDWRTPIGFWSPARMPRPLRLDHDHRRADRHQSVRCSSVRPRPSVQFCRAEGLFTEFNLSSNVPAKQTWHHYRTLLRYSFRCRC